MPTVPNRRSRRRRAVRKHLAEAATSKDGIFSAPASVFLTLLLHPGQAYSGPSLLIPPEACPAAGRGSTGTEYSRTDSWQSPGLYVTQP